MSTAKKLTFSMAAALVTVLLSAPSFADSPSPAPVAMPYPNCDSTPTNPWLALLGSIVAGFGL
jgi:hypothetical protein